VRAIIDGWSLFAEVWEMPLGRWSAKRQLYAAGQTVLLSRVGIKKSLRSTIAGGDQLKLSPTQKHWKLGSFFGAKSIIAVLQEDGER
jgi:hypothetical protein